MRTHPVAVVAMLSLARCAGGDPDALIDHTVAELTVVPGGVLCVRVAVTEPGAAARNVNAAVTAAANAQIDLGVVAAGSVTFQGSAYNVACGSVTANTRPSWVGDPVVATIRRGLVNAVALTLRPLTTTTTTVDFAVPAVSLAAAQNTSVMYAVMQDGSVRAWGTRSALPLGDGSASAAPQLTPTTVLGVSNAASVVAGYQHACVLSRDGAASCWGLNDHGQLGSPSDARALPTPTPVATSLRFSALAVSNGLTCGVERDPVGARVWCWGDNGRGFVSPSLALGDTAVPFDTGYAAHGGIVGAPNGFCLLSGAQQAACWGAGFYGRESPFPSLTTPALTPFPLASELASSFGGAGVEHICGVHPSGAVWCAGDSNVAPLGASNAYDARVVEGVAAARQVSVGRVGACAVVSDGGVVCWGRAEVAGSAQFREGAFVAPTRIAGLRDVTDVAVGAGFACALQSDGAVWCWGSNDDGALGNGTRVTSYAPVRVRF